MDNVGWIAVVHGKWDDVQVKLELRVANCTFSDWMNGDLRSQGYVLGEMVDGQTVQTIHFRRPGARPVGFVFPTGMSFEAASSLIADTYAVKTVTMMPAICHTLPVVMVFPSDQPEEPYLTNEPRIDDRWESSKTELDD